MSLLNKILGAVTIVLGFFALFQRNRADRNEAEAERETQRADAAESESNTHERVDSAVHAVEQKQKQEQRNVDKTLADGKRDQLDNDG